MPKSHSQIYLEQPAEMAALIDHEAVKRIALGLADLPAKSGACSCWALGVVP